MIYVMFMKIDSHEYSPSIRDFDESISMWIVDCVGSDELLLSICRSISIRLDRFIRTRAKYIREIITTLLFRRISIHV